MARPLRIDFPGAVHHVMNRGWQRQPIFLEPHDFQTFLRLLHDTVNKFDLKLFAYCLMTNHYHLALRSDGNLSRAIRHLNSNYAQAFNRKYSKDGSLFRGRFRSIFIEHELYLREVIRYIHMNPVEAKLTKSPEEYAWSSHHLYLRKASSSPLEIEFVLSLFSQVHRNARELFHAFVQKDSPQKLVGLLNAGSINVLGGVPPDKGERTREVARPRPLAQKTSESVLRKLFQNTFGVSAESATCRQNAHIRRMAVRAYFQVLKWPTSKIADKFGITNVQTVSRILHKKQNYPSPKELEDKLDSMLKKVKVKT